MAIAWNLGFGEPFRKNYGTSITHTLQFFDGKATDYFADKAEYGRFGRKLGELIGNTHFQKMAAAEARNFLLSTLGWAEENFSRDLSKMKNPQLLRLYRSFALEKEPKFYARMWMVYRISNPLSRKVEEEILKHTGDEKPAADLFGVFSTPLKMNNVMEERVSALKLAIVRNTMPATEYRLLLQKHAENYAYVPMFGFDHEPFSNAHFENEISKIKEPEKELESILNSYMERRHRHERGISKLKPSPQLLQLLNFYSEIIHLRDYRDMIREKVNFAARKLYLEIAKRARLTIEQINLLTNEEIIAFLEKGKLPAKAEILSREKHWLIMQDGKITKIFSGNAAIKIAQTQIGKKREKDVQELEGMTGSGGRAAGTARIIHTNKDLPGVRPGDIMITSMTRQDFTPYLRKCAALVTDEGGVTSHAAIICRELGIPCIVGTENATTTFKDGDLVEVDADNGIVRRIKSK